MTLNADELRALASALRLSAAWCRACGTLPANQIAENCEDAAEAVGSLLAERDALKARVERLEGALRAADYLRERIRESGMKRHPVLYLAVMSYDAARAALKGDEQ